MAPSRAAIWEGRLYVTLVILTTLFISGTSLSTIHHMHPPESQPRQTIIHLILIALSLLTYLQTHLTPPGTTTDWPQDRPDLAYPHALPHARPYIPPQAQTLPTTVPSSPSSEGSPPPPRRCPTCKSQKPPRVHHCSVCETCVLRYDHHCPWVANCIGLRNYKPFLQYLLYTTFASIHAVGALFHGLLPERASRTPTRGWALLAAMLAPVAFAVSIAVAISLAALFACNFWLAARNQTALERLRRGEGPSARCKTVIDYDTGDIISNLRHVLGWHIWLWLVPIPQQRTPPRGACRLKARVPPSVSLDV